MAGSMRVCGQPALLGLDRIAALWSQTTAPSGGDLGHLPEEAAAVLAACQDDAAAGVARQ